MHIIAVYTLVQQSNKGDRMESDAPTGNAFTLWYHILFSPFASGECRKKRSTSLPREAHDDIYFVAKAPL